MSLAHRARRGRRCNRSGRGARLGKAAIRCSYGTPAARGGAFLPWPVARAAKRRTRFPQLAKIAGSDFRQSKIKPGKADSAAIPGSLNPASPSAYEFTIAFRLFSGITRTFLLAGLALNIIFSPVKGLIPSRAFVAGFLTTFILSRPGMVKRPLLFRLFLITPLSESNTPPICLRDSPVSLEI